MLYNVTLENETVDKRKSNLQQRDKSSTASDTGASSINNEKEGKYKNSRQNNLKRENSVGEFEELKNMKLKINQYTPTQYTNDIYEKVEKQQQEIRAEKKAQRSESMHKYISNKSSSAKKMIPGDIELTEGKDIDQEVLQSHLSPSRRGLVSLSQERNQRKQQK